MIFAILTIFCKIAIEYMHSVADRAFRSWSRIPQLFYSLSGFQVSSEGKTHMGRFLNSSTSFFILHKVWAKISKWLCTWDTQTKRQSPIKTQILQVSAMKNEAVNKSFNLIRSRKTLIPLFSLVLLCKFAINMLGEPRERG